MNQRSNPCITSCELIRTAALVGLFLFFAPFARADWSFTVTNGNPVEVPVDPYPIPTPDTAVEHYGYDPGTASSSNPDFQLSNELIVLFSLDHNGDYALSVFIDDLDDGSGGLLEMCLTGMPGAELLVLDDPGDLYIFNPAAGEGAILWNWWPCCTDGVVINLGPVPPEELCLNVTAICGIDGIRFRAYQAGADDWLELTDLSPCAPLCISAEYGETAGARETLGDFSLRGAYPNPFNPVTTIAYSLPETDYAVLKVYDLAGRELHTLVNGLVSAGEHSVQFDASRLCSGTYFCTLRSGGRIETQKLLLMK